MKVSFDAPLLLLSGEPLIENGESAILGKFLANFLVSSNKGDAFKFYDWAKDMYKGKTIDFDRADQDLIKKTIKEADTLTNLVKAQLLELFEKKAEGEKPPEVIQLQT